MGAAITRSQNTKYTQIIEAYWEKLLKIVKIALLQFNYELSWWNVTFDNNYEWLNDFIWKENKQKSITKTRNMSQLCDFITRVSVDNYFFPSVNIFKMLWRSYCQKISMT